MRKDFQTFSYDYPSEFLFSLKIVRQTINLYYSVLQQLLALSSDVVDFSVQVAESNAEGIYNCSQSLLELGPGFFSS